MAAKRTKRGRPRGGPLEQIRRALPRMLRELKRRAMNGDVEAIKACHEIILRETGEEVLMEQRLLAHGVEEEGREGKAEGGDEERKSPPSPTS